MDAITLTFGDCMENHTGMQKIGTRSENGYTLENILCIKNKLDENLLTELVCLNEYLPENEKSEKAYILIIRNFLDNDFANNIFNEHNKLVPDKKYYDTRRQKVLNKLARWNLCFDNFSQDPDYENKKGTIINYNDVQFTNKLKENIFSLVDDNSLKLEANYYYNLKTTGIGFHGDTERKKVVGVRLGKPNELVFKWFKNDVHIGTVFKTILNHGDIYIMSEKAVGFDWKSRSKITLRHAAGCKKYTN